jgi:hypothetical protein
VKYFFTICLLVNWALALTAAISENWAGFAGCSLGIVTLGFLMIYGAILEQNDWLKDEGSDALIDTDGENK